MSNQVFNFVTGGNVFVMPAAASMNVVTVYAGIVGSLVAVTDTAGRVYNPASGLNQIGNMVAGANYTVQVSAACTLTLAIATPTSTVPAWTTASILSGELYCRLSTADAAKYASELAALITEITDAMIDYIGSIDIDPANPPARLQRACAKQCAYEWQRRRELGLSSTTFQSGTVNKYEVKEWLPDVEAAMKRCRSMSF